MVQEVKLNGVWRHYRLGRGANEGYFEVLIGGVWKRVADVTRQRDSFETRRS